eukprot:TRINITY_DN4723_c0_g2_i1.p1 TRINITY_DN4723_c0_g2~~TRINITY_DN4723_c0_g2_i1.p1  ORF type:complete len:693 (-),score=146.89 TRINITY_DN4723_c0_g2_i1:92-2170(-)
MMQSYPVNEIVPRLKSVLSEGNRCVLSAPPGAGKTTVLPLALMDEEWLEDKKILVLEPRRLAAYAAACRLAENLGEAPGKRIGYRMRLESKPGSRVEIVTGGVLTRMIQHDPELRDYGCIVFDEFHERSVDSDLGLALTLDIQEALRPDMRILLMSATVDCAATAELLDGCPVVKSLGRSYPVTTLYRQRNTGRDMHALVRDTVMHALVHESGGILVFLPGEGNIRTLESELKTCTTEDICIHPLYGRLSNEQQRAAIAPAPEGIRKIVLATSIAESSLTIDGVRIVVDAGLTRKLDYDPVTDMSRLETVKISKASADQRRGRAGRLEPGICYRLWTEQEHEALADYTAPEILNCDLAPVALELAVWGVSSPEELKWLDIPDKSAWARSCKLLRDLEALDDSGRINAHGKALARTGLHPRLGHMIVKAVELGYGILACEIAAIISEYDIRKLNSPDLSEAVMELRRACRGYERAGKFRSDLCRQMSVNRAPRQGDADDIDKTGLLLAFAWPDRIARRRESGGMTYVMTCGRGARFRTGELLMKHEFIVAAEVDSGDRDALIYLAASLERKDINRFFGNRYRSETAMDIDRRILRFEERVFLGSMMLESRQLTKPEPNKVLAAILEFIRRQGLTVLEWTPELEAFRNRIAFLHEADPDHDWPAMSDAALLDNLEKMAGSFRRRRSQTRFYKEH